MRRQSHELIERLSGKEGGQVIGWSSPRADVEVADNKGSLLKVDELLEKVCGPVQRFFL